MQADLKSHNGEQVTFDFGDSKNVGARPLIFRPIHYLGSKLRVLPRILAEIDNLEPTGGRVADLFSGSGTVAAALSTQREVTAIDIQEYSRVLCRALLGLSCIDSEGVTDFERRVEHSVLRQKLSHCLEPLILLESDMITRAEQGELEPLCDLFQRGSIFLRENGTPLHNRTKLDAALDESSRRLKSERLEGSPHATVSRYFGGIYFSYQQAVDLDTALDAVDQADNSSRDALLAAVLSTASSIVNTIGKQFAQPIRPIDSAGMPKRHLIRQIKEDRLGHVLPTLKAWLNKYASLPRHTTQHLVVRGDFSVIEHEKDIRIVYADPPYTRDHYSRYYHVLETMCLRDNPEVSKLPGAGGAPSRGMYRTDRHQSPFCIKSQAKGAFEKLFMIVRSLGVPLLLSYSPYPQDREARPRVLTIDNLIELSRNYFSYVDVVSAGNVAHNKLNSSDLNFASPGEGELLLACRP